MEADVRWWEDEVKQLDRKLTEAKRMFELRKSERDAKREKEKAKPSTSQNRH